MKKVIFKSILCCMLIMVSLVFCGCSNVSYVNYTDEDGVYTEVVEITLNEQILKDNGFEDIQKVKQDISDHVNTTLLSKYSSYCMRLDAKIAEYKDNPEKQDLYNAYKDLVDDVIWESQPFYESNYFYIKLKFSSKSAYLFFYDIKENNFSNKEVKKGLFYDTIYFKGNLGYQIQNSLYSYLRFSPYLKQYFDVFTYKDVDLTYSYLTQSARYKSNADTTYYAGDNYYAHVWNVDTENMEREIYFSLRIANRWIWYVTAIGISLFTTLILVIIAIIIHFCKKIKSKEKNPMEP